MVVRRRDVLAEDAEDVSDVAEAAVDAAVQPRRARRRGGAAAGAEQVRAPRGRGRPPRRRRLPHV